jgi:hypothetical protein
MDFSWYWAPTRISPQYFNNSICTTLRLFIRYNLNFSLKGSLLTENTSLKEGIEPPKSLPKQTVERKAEEFVVVEVSSAKLTEVEGENARYIYFQLGFCAGL